MRPRVTAHELRGEDFLPSLYRPCSLSFKADEITRLISIDAEG